MRFRVRAWDLYGGLLHPQNARGLAEAARVDELRMAQLW